jgi:hypothetical protein
MNHKPLVGFATLMGLVASASGLAAVHFDLTPGTGAPPPTLGGFVMSPFPADGRPLRTMVTDAAPPPAFGVPGDLQFDEAVELNQVGSAFDDWSTWSHGYTGNVYYHGYDTLGMDLPTGTLAFHLYVQPELLFATLNFSVTCDGVSISPFASIDGNGGASYIGFYTDNPADPLERLIVTQVTLPDVGFAVGEFGVNIIPEPRSCAAMVGLGLLGLAALRRLHRRLRRTP